MTPEIAVRYPDGTIHVAVGYADPSTPVFACGTDVLSPGDDDYDFYAARAVPASEHHRTPPRDPARAAALKAEFRRRYRRDHGRRSA
ncbi:hypothetical protein ACFOVU_16245 [Nocardiopsis sediminis]|uniref:Uncharacterized protein n=1 Tax=Nocardiopsis sediminis TaxID=1778267 RepID=A0ABV8FQ44_9ACTN